MSDPAQQTSDTAGVQRTATGEIATQTQTTSPAATTDQTSTTSEKPSLVNEKPEGTDAKPSLANQPPATGAPAEYSAYTTPDGFELDPETNKAANEMFKAMGLSQENAQKLVDFYVAKTTESQNAPYKVWNEMQTKWVDEVKNDPVLGPRLDQVKTTISRAIDGLGDPKLARDFREAMDFTGAGNNPAFIRAFYKLAQQVTEGGHVAGNGPSRPSQERQGTPPSAARAMYPNLP